jgi:hypothetical protein
MRSGTFPASQKAAIVVPALKKSTLDPLDMANYRPISNLSFVSKLLERCVNDQLSGHLRANDLLPEVQSAYRSNHSTETAVLKVLSDAYAAADNKDVTLLCLLDLSAAFDTVDHGLLLARLRHTYGLRGPVLDWFQSYLSDRSQVVCYNGQTSAATTVAYVLASRRVQFSDQTCSSCTLRRSSPSLESTVSQHTPTLMTSSFTTTLTRLAVRRSCRVCLPALRK